MAQDAESVLQSFYPRRLGHGTTHKVPQNWVGNRSAWPRHRTRIALFAWVFTRRCHYSARAYARGRVSAEIKPLQLRAWGLLFADVYATRLGLGDFTYGSKQGFGYVQASDFY